MDFIFEQLKTGGDRNFAYLIGDRPSGRALAVDPSYGPELVLERASEQKLRIEVILNTHGHSDHTNGNVRLKELTQAEVVGSNSSLHQTNRTLEDEEKLDIGGLRLEVFHTPGHTDDHLVVYCPEYRTLCTGDLLFVGKVGGTHSEQDARTEWSSLRRLIKLLPEETSIWPGHDYGCRPSSTMLLETRTNPFLLCKTVEEFLSLKSNWSEFKSKNGLK